MDDGILKPEKSFPTHGIIGYFLCLKLKSESVQILLGA